MEGTNVSEANSTSAVFEYDGASMIQTIRFWAVVGIVPVGIAGNVLCIFVMGQKHNRSISCSAYIAALAVCDIMYLISISTYTFFNEAFNFDQGVIFCKGMFFSMGVSTRSGVMIIMALLVERTIAVMRPMKAVIFLSPKRAMITVFIVVFLTALFNLPLIFSTSRLQGGACIAIESDDLFHVIHNIVSLLLFGLIPLVDILVLNLMIMFTIKSSKNAFGKQTKAGTYATNISSASTSDNPNTASEDLDFHMNVKNEISNVDNDITEEMTSPKQKARKNCASITTVSEGLDNPVMGEPEINANTGAMGEEGNEQYIGETKVSHDGYTGQRAKDRQMTVMTVAMTLAFFIFTTPSYVHLLLFRYYDPKSSPEMQTLHGWSGTVVLISNTLNSSINFFLYAFTGSKFRSDFKNLICCHRKSIR